MPPVCQWSAIAGSLLGARWGASAVPEEWCEVVHGWPGLTVTELGRRGAALAAGVHDAGASRVSP